MSNNQTIIYYNQKCSKCRMTLEMLREKGKQPEIVEYLQNIPSKSELKNILTQ